jgi:hypothetical protein
MYYEKTLNMKGFKASEIHLQLLFYSTDQKNIEQYNEINLPWSDPVVNFPLPNSQT